jgi:inner membrane transporter RhtA
MPVSQGGATGQRPGWTPYAALLGSIVSLCVGTSYAKRLFPLVGATGASAWRVGGAAFLLLLIWRPWRAPPSPQDLRRVAAYGLVLGAMNLCFYLALRTLPLGLAIAIEFTGPLAVAVLSSRRLRDLAWVALAAAGLAGLLPLGSAGLQVDPAGLAWILAAALFWALYIVIGKRTAHLPAGPTVALGMSVAALLVAPVGVAQAGPALLSPAVAVSGLAVAVLSSALPYSLEMVALRGLSRRTFGVMVSLEPAVGTLAGLLMLGERLDLRQALAIVAVIAASLGCVLTEKAQAKPELLPA